MRDESSLPEPPLDAAAASWLERGGPASEPLSGAALAAFAAAAEASLAEAVERM